MRLCGHCLDRHEDSESFSKVMKSNFTDFIFKYIIYFKCESNKRDANFTQKWGSVGADALTDVLLVRL